MQTQHRYWVSFLLLPFLLLSPLSAVSLNKESDKNIFMLTMPKSGTHMLIKFWYLLTGEDHRFFPHYQSPRSAAECRANRSYDLTHFYYPTDMLERQLADKEKLTVINIRDPRDVLLSAIPFLAEHPSSWLSPKTKAWFAKLPFDEQLMFLIRDLSNYLSLRRHIRQVVTLSRDPRVVVCRFEDLVGPEGGGDRERQYTQILTLANTFGIELSSDELEYLGDSVFGKNVTEACTGTFRKGQIGGWREAFSAKHKERFKKCMGKELIALGYEKDHNW